jgi:hypothetical protein
MMHAGDSPFGPTRRRAPVLLFSHGYGEVDSTDYLRVAGASWRAFGYCRAALLTDATFLNVRDLKTVVDVVFPATHQSNSMRCRAPRRSRCRRRLGPRLGQPQWRNRVDAHRSSLRRSMERNR